MIWENQCSTTIHLVDSTENQCEEYLPLGSAPIYVYIEDFMVNNTI